MEPLPLGQLGTTPWSFSPLWFFAAALAIPALVWLAFAWRRAVLECPNRVRRAGVREMRRLLKKLQRADGTPRPAHLHAWLRATARVWDVRTSAPCVTEVAQSAHVLTGDATVSSRWRELWQVTEYSLYAPDTKPTKEWMERAASAAATVGMPKREQFLPNRLGHWLPSVGVALFLITSFAPPTSDADVPWSAPPRTESPTETAPVATELSASEAAPTEEPPAPVLLTEAEGHAAQAALDSNWNDWAAHRNLAAYQTQEGELNLAIAHATAAFVQHPTAASTRDTLLAAVGETPSIDPNLRRLLSGAWYERIPTMYSAAGWQRVALFAALMVALSLSVMIFALYAPRGQRLLAPMPLAWIGRGGFAIGALMLMVALSSWNAYGALNHSSAAILLQAANASPVPTDLVPAEETSPLSAGTVVLTHRTFLGWREVSNGPERSGWVRSNAVMPLYASR